MNENVVGKVVAVRRYGDYDASVIVQTKEGKLHRFIVDETSNDFDDCIKVLDGKTVKVTNFRGKLTDFRIVPDKTKAAPTQ